MHPPLRAMIFDFDGVLADTEPLHFETLAAVLGEEGIELTREVNDREYIGLDVVRSFEKAFADSRRELSPETRVDLIRRKSDRFVAEAGRIRLFPGIREVVLAASSRFPCAVASGALRAEIVPVLEHHGLRDAFGPLVTADDGLPSKPDPAPFRRALDMLRAGSLSDLAAAETLVVEDSVPGIIAARRAEMRCVALAHSHPAEALRDADLVLESAASWDWRLLPGTPFFV